MGTVKDIFGATDCISEEMLVKYIAGKLPAAEKHEVEKHLIDCEMCSDAVEGLSRIEPDKIRGITSELNQKIRQRAVKKEVKIIFLQQYRTQLAVAASIVAVLGLVWFFKANMSMKELDTESANKIFADKFEPYPATPQEDAENTTAVTEVPALTKTAEEHSVLKGGKEGLKNAIAEDKQTLTKEVQFAEQVGAGDVSKNAEGYYRAEADAKKTEAPTLAEPKADVQVRDESAAVSYEKNKMEESKPADKKAPEKIAQVTTTSAASGSATTAQPASNMSVSKANDNREQEEAQKNQQGVQLMAIETKSKSGKDRSKNKKSSDTQPVQAPAASSPVTATQTVDQESRLDSVSAGLDGTKTGADDGDMADIAMQKYEQKDFAGANEDFEKTLAKDPDNYNALFYSAVSYLGEGKTDKAITNLNKVLEKKDGEFYDAAQWYLSLAYIKKSDTQNARRNLTELQKNSRSRYQKQADETLKQMEK